VSDARESFAQIIVPESADSYYFAVIDAKEVNNICDSTLLFCVCGCCCFDLTIFHHLPHFDESKPMAEDSPFGDDFSSAPVDGSPFGSVAPSSESGGQTLDFGDVSASQPATSPSSNSFPGMDEKGLSLGGGLPSTEPTPLSLWEEKRAVSLAEREQKALDTKSATSAEAKEAIEKFYRDRDEKLTKNQSVNRADEKSFRSDMESLMKFGTRWEKVNKLVNVAPKATEKSRVERQRKLLVQLKNVRDHDEVESKGL